jgi:hypothetical protein
MAQNKKNSAGRPSSFSPQFVTQANKLCSLGATDVEMADFFGVAVSTFYKWKNEFPAFSEALKAGKTEADDRVERSLYHKAIGYTFEAVKIMAVKGEVEKVPYREHVPPDTTAAIFWLKNRRPDKWRDIQKHEIGNPGDFDRMSDDELARYVADESARVGKGLH